MENSDLVHRARAAFRSGFGRDAAVAAYAPGRIEVLGNHTDYNEGLVLSAAIDAGTVFLAGRSAGSRCRILDPGFEEEAEFDARELRAPAERPWARYIQGVLHGLQERGVPPEGFQAVLLGNIPLGAGLSSSASLEMASGTALARLFGVTITPMDLARIGQTAEHRFVGVQCGLLDQISSLFGKRDCLVMTDFRTLAIESIPLGSHVRFLMCNTRVRRALVDGEYNARRAQCEQAAAFFAGVLAHPVRALRDVNWREWEAWESRLNPQVARRAAHVIGENARVEEGRRLLARGDLAGFGRLMFESHESSRVRFENSCPELDAIVEIAAQIPGVLGARLSGGGFGGSAVVLVRSEAAETAAATIRREYARRFEAPCDVRAVIPSDGARLL